MPALFNRTFGTDVQKSQITQIFDAWEGASSQGVPFNLTSVSDNSSFAATIRNLGSAGALKVQDSGGNILLRINDNGTLIAMGTLTTNLNVISSTVTWNASGVTFTAWKLNVTSTASAAASLLLDLQLASVSQFSVTKAGTVSVAAAEATPAGGSTTCRLVFGTTAGFGIYIGSGAPTVSAAKGSLYLRSDGSTTNDRAYIATNSSGTFTALTTAA